MKRIGLLILGVSGRQASPDRDRLIALLQEIGTSDHIPRSDEKIPLERIESLLDASMGSTAGLQKKGESEAPESWIEIAGKSALGVSGRPKRRRSHPGCECPDNFDDSADGKCMERRATFLHEINMDLETLDASGMAVEVGRLQLRRAFSKLLNASAEMDSSTNQLVKSITLNNTGYLSLANNQAKHIMNSEYNMVLGLNNVWMNLIDAAKTSMDSMEHIERLRGNATANISSYFSRMQTEEEDTNYKNQMQVIGIAQGQLNRIAADLTKSLRLVWEALNGLDKSIGGSEASSSQLSDALASASDSLSESIDNFAQVVDDRVQSSQTAMRDTIGNLKSQFEKAAQAALDGTTATAAQKTADAVATGLNQTQAQDASMGLVVGRATNATMGAVARVQSDSDAFSDYTDSLYGGITRSVNADVVNATAVMQREYAARQSALARIDGATSQIQQAVTAASTAGQQHSAASSTQLSNQQQATSTGVTWILGDIAQRSADNLAKVQQVSEGAVSGVGSLTQSSVAQLSAQFNQGQSSFSQQANKAASAARAATGSLSVTYTAGANGVDAASDGVHTALSSGTSGLFNLLSNVGNNMFPTALFLGGVGDAVQDQNAHAQALLALATDNVTSGGFATDVLGEAQVQNILSFLALGGLNATALTEQLRQRTSGNVTIESLVDDIDAAVGDGIGGAEDALGGSNEAFAQVLAKAFSGVAIGSSDAADSYIGVARKLTSSSDTLGVGKQALDTADAANVEKTDDAGAVLDSSGNTLKKTGNSAVNAFSASSGAVDSATDNGWADVYDAAASGDSESSEAIQKYMDQISSLNASAPARAAFVGLTQLERVRSVAASVDSLMDQVSGFIHQNNGELYGRLADLPTKVQKLQTVLASVQARQNVAVPTAVWDRVVRDMYGRLHWLNGTAASVLADLDGVFSKNSTEYVAQVLEKVNDLLSEFDEASSALKSDLDRVELAGTSAETQSIGNDQGVLGKMSAIVGQVRSVQSGIVAALSGLSGKSTNPEGMGGLFGTVAGITGGASDNALAASGVAGSLQQAALGQAQNASRISATMKASAMQLQQQAAVASLNQASALAQLQQQERAMAALQADTMSTVNDFTNQADLYASAKFNSASYVYDQVQKASADTAAAMGSILKKVAADQANVSNTLDGDTASTGAALAVVRTQVARLDAIFDTYVDSAKRQFAAALSDQDGFGDAIQMQAKNELNSVSNSLYKTASELVAAQGEIAADIANITSADDFDASYSQLEQSLDTWAAAERAQISKLAGDAQIGRTDSVTPESVTAAMSSVVATLASAASTMLSNFGLAVPAVVTGALADPTGSLNSLVNATI